ncbi:uncharacterized protein [Solanum lycopersicum]|uniref:uncharacterized protein n=1 Tax=Solanum lycopersicum TaxID=4081 RepID=UPI0037484790
MEKEQMKFRLSNKEATFNICRSMKESSEIQIVSTITYVVESVSEVQVDERLGVEALTSIIKNFDGDGIEEYGFLVATFERNEYRLKPTKLELGMKHRESPSARPSIVEAPKLEIKALLMHLMYVFLGKDDTSPVIIATNLNGQQEKFHFMVKVGIVLGNQIIEKGIEVDWAKVEVIEKLPPPISIKRVRSFLGCAGFYRRFVKDFSEIAHPLCKLLEKDCKFYFNKSCVYAFGELKEKLVSAPIVISPNWGEPFEVMCDASGWHLVWYCD